MPEQSVTQKITDLGETAESERWATLFRLAKVTALKDSPEGNFHLGHWWRGPLLYALMQHYKPRQVLEFGTGRGYGAAAMALASVDSGFESTIWTIDVIRPDARQPWAIEEDNQPALKNLCLDEVWSKHVPSEVRERVRFLTGSSLSVMKTWRGRGLPPVDFCFIDGGHGYWAVKHDFIAGLNVANPHCTFLFDDYTDRKGYGVRPLIDGDISPRLRRDSVEIIDMNANDYTPYREIVPHKMALFHCDHRHPAALRQFYSSAEVLVSNRFYALHEMVKAARLRIRKTARSLARWFVGR